MQPEALDRFSQWRPDMEATEVRKTFVVWVGGGPDPKFHGRLEDVDTGRQFRFASAEELVTFLQGSIEEERNAKD